MAQAGSDISTVCWLPKDWGQLSANDRTNVLFNVGITQTTSVANWYQKRKKRLKTSSQLLRLATVFLLIAGGIAPLAAGLFRGEHDAPLALHIIEAGYIMLALAGGATLLDKLYGLSGGWMRYMVALRRIDSVGQAYVLRWADLTKPGTDAVEDVTPYLDCTRQLFADINLIIDNDVNEWLDDFRGALGQLDNSAKVHGAG